MVTWVIEKQITDTRVRWTRDIEAACNATGHHFIEFEDLEKIPHINDHVVLYGSSNIFDIQDKKNYRPGIFEIPDDVTVLKHLGSHCLNSDMEIMDVHNVLQFMNESEHSFFFVKANTPRKFFSGKVVDSCLFSSLWKKAKNSPHYDEKVQVCISEHKELGREWRLFVVDGEIVSWSQYKNRGRLSIEQYVSMEAYQFARNIIDTVYDPASAYVMDICETNAGLKLVEYNTLNCSGIYKCNATHIVQSVNDFIERTYV